MVPALAPVGPQLSGRDPASLFAAEHVGQTGDLRGRTSQPLGYLGQAHEVADMHRKHRTKWHHKATVQHLVAGQKPPCQNHASPVDGCVNGMVSSLPFKPHPALSPSGIEASPGKPTGPVQILAENLGTAVMHKGRADNIGRALQIQLGNQVGACQRDQIILAEFYREQPLGPGARVNRITTSGPSFPKVVTWLTVSKLTGNSG